MKKETIGNNRYDKQNQNNMKKISRKELNETAQIYAAGILGDEQYNKNKLAVKSVMEDFKKGFEHAELLYLKTNKKY